MIMHMKIIINNHNNKQTELNKTELNKIELNKIV